MKTKIENRNAIAVVIDLHRRRVVEATIETTANDEAAMKAIEATAVTTHAVITETNPEATVAEIGTDIEIDQANLESAATVAIEEVIAAATAAEKATGPVLVLPVLELARNGHLRTMR